MSYEGPGIYEHFKGGLYYVIGASVREETITDVDDLGVTEVTDVVYAPFKPYDRDEVFVTRRLEVFNEMVPDPAWSGGALVPRFRMIELLNPDALVGFTPQMLAAHWAFYNLTIAQRDAAWRKVEQLKQDVANLQQSVSDSVDVN